MTLRKFDDDSGRTWEVWDVYPARVRSWLDGERARSAAPDHTPTTPSLDRVGLADGMRDGWLAFHCETESRRLAPIPGTWPVIADTELIRLLGTARPTPKHPVTARSGSAGLRDDG